MGVFIERVNNGWILTDAENVKHVFECEGSEVAAFRKLLWVLLDSEGPTTTRYSPERICIEIHQGDKYDPGIQEFGMKELDWDEQAPTLDEVPEWKGV